MSSYYQANPMTDNLLLDTYLKQLRLPTFLQNYRKFAEDAAQADLTYDRFLLSLAEQEVTQREINREARRIKAARFPVLKELAEFDFSCIASPGKQQVLDLARGAYLQQVQNIILVGNPGLGKTHVSIGLSLAACRQGHKVRFFNAAALVNELIIAQENHLLVALAYADDIFDGDIPVGVLNPKLYLKCSSSTQGNYCTLTVTQMQCL